MLVRGQRHFHNLIISILLGNPVPEAKWVLRGRIVNNNTSPTGVGNQIYLIHELGEQRSITTVPLQQIFVAQRKKKLSL